MKQFIFIPVMVLLGIWLFYARNGGPTSALVRDLESSNKNEVYDAFYFLTKRANPVAVPRALELLKSSDDYTWLNAAMYLGACNRLEAIPYLIKSLRHSAWRSDDEKVKYLKSLTGEEIGVDFESWLTWWKQQPNYAADFDWESSLGHAPRLRRSAPVLERR